MEVEGLRRENRELVGKKRQLEEEVTRLKQKATDADLAQRETKVEIQSLKLDKQQAAMIIDQLRSTMATMKDAVRAAEASAEEARMEAIVRLQAYDSKFDGFRAFKARVDRNAGVVELDDSDTQ